MKKFRARRRLIKVILSLVQDGRGVERRIDKLFGNLQTNCRIKSIPQEQLVMDDASRFINGLRNAEDRLEYITLGESPWDRLRFSKEAEYWENIKPRRFELDLRIGKFIWDRQSKRWIRKEERKRFKRPACRKLTIGTLTRLERIWLSFRQQQNAMVDNISYLPYSFPLLNAIKYIKWNGEDDPARRTGWHTEVEDRNRSIQRARVELEMAEEHIYIFSENVLPMCLEGTDITKDWRKRCRRARQLALVSTEWKEYIAACTQIVTDIQSAFLHRASLHRAEKQLIQAVKVIKLLKSRYGRNFKPPRSELKSIDKLLSNEAPTAWLDNDWARLFKITSEQAHKLAEFTELLRSWLTINQIPIDEELIKELRPLPTLETVAVEQIREHQASGEGYISAGKLGTVIDPSLAETWNRADQ